MQENEDTVTIMKLHGLISVVCFNNEFLQALKINYMKMVDI